MRTKTIYDACDKAEDIWNPYRNENFDTYPEKRVNRAERQTRKFHAELLRRMDERDARIPELKATLASCEKRIVELERQRNPPSDRESWARWLLEASPLITNRFGADMIASSIAYSIGELRAQIAIRDKEIAALKDEA